MNEYKVYLTDKTILLYADDFKLSYTYRIVRFVKGDDNIAVFNFDNILGSAQITDEE